MFCPGCGLEENQTNQYCRACGSNLSLVRTAIERPDQVTNSAALARSEIGRVIASRVNEIKTAREMTIVTEVVLPKVSKFLESPAEQKLRRLREGVVTAATGIGITVLFAIVTIFTPWAMIAAGAGLLVLCVGLGILITGLWLSTPPRSVEDKSIDAQHQRELDQSAAAQTGPIRLVRDKRVNVPSSVTEHTTHQLGED